MLRLVDRVPAWLRQTAILVVVYFALMWTLSRWLTAWHDWDWAFFDLLVPAPTVLSSEIALVDMQYADPTQVPEHRRMLAAFIAAASKQHPRAIVLDIPFGACIPSCDAAMSDSRLQLTRSIRQSINDGVPVFANIGKIDLTPDGLPDGAPPSLDPRIYSELSGYGHTSAVIRSETDRTGDLFYFPCYPNYPPLFGNSTPQDEPDLVDVALYRDRLSGDAESRRPCDEADEVAVRYGPSIDDVPPTEYHITQSHPFPAHAEFSGSYVLVGVPRFDKDPKVSSRSGSDVFAWIMSDELTYRHFLRERPQESGLSFLVPAFSLVTVLAFGMLFFLLRRQRLGVVRRFLPWMTAALSLVVGAGTFLAYEMWMSGRQHEVQPQVALITLGMVLTSALGGIRGAQIDFAERNAIDATGPPEEYDYDVFISYAHDELDWVFQNVYRKLEAARLPGDKKLKLFFDTSAIRIGTAWQDKISLSIDGSRFIVPIYSETYFGRPYCRFEIKRAHRKWINAGEESRCVLPIMRGRPKILQTVDDIQAIAIEDHPDAVDGIIEEILARLGPSAVADSSGKSTQPITE